MWIVDHAIVVGCVGVVVVLLVIQVFVSPYRIELDQLATYQAELQQHRQILEQQQRDWKTFADSLTTMSSADIDIVMESIPPQPAVPELLVQLERLVAQHGFVISSISLHEAKRLDDVDKSIMMLPVTMKVAGPTYQGFRQLLESMQTHIRLFDVNAIYFVPDMNEYTIDFSTYYLGL
jgi:Tfp pilus assembly protein PilO